MAYLPETYPPSGRPGSGTKTYFDLKDSDSIRLLVLGDPISSSDVIKIVIFRLGKSLSLISIFTASIAIRFPLFISKIPGPKHLLPSILKGNFFKVPIG